MSTNKTEHYHLHQWAASDPVSLPEVNGNFAAIDAAVKEAREAAEVLPYVIGSYTGTGKTGIEVKLGFRPSFLFITRTYGSSSEFLGMDSVAAYDQTGREKVIQINDDGFTVIIISNYHPKINLSGVVYNYIAFR
jgi:hypothetical protein